MNEQHSTEKAAPALVRCTGTGTPARNVTRAWVGNRLPMVGDCQACGRQIEITQTWTVKHHRNSVIPPGYAPAPHGAGHGENTK